MNVILLFVVLIIRLMFMSLDDGKYKYNDEKYNYLVVFILFFKTD